MWQFVFGWFLGVVSAFFLFVLLFVGGQFERENERGK